jgi:hypothetical protein
MASTFKNFPNKIHRANKIAQFSMSRSKKKKKNIPANKEK